jgi:SAM-dependent methyltransferase
MSIEAVQINADWNLFQPRQYLNEWHSELSLEISLTIEFLSKAFRAMDSDTRVIDFCSGPAIYQYIAAAPYVAEIHGSDYLDENLAEIRMWLDKDADAFDWTHEISEALRIEGHSDPAAAAIAHRAELVRQKVTRLVRCDIRNAHPLDVDPGRVYDVVSHCYGADVVADTVDEWEAYVANCCTVLKPGGTLLMTLIKEANWWPNGDHVHQALSLNEGHVTAALERIGFDPASIVLEAHEVADASKVGYSHVIFVRATLGAAVA